MPYSACQRECVLIFFRLQNLHDNLLVQRRQHCHFWVSQYFTLADDPADKQIHLHTPYHPRSAEIHGRNCAIDDHPNVSQLSNDSSQNLLPQADIQLRRRMCLDLCHCRLV